MKKLLLTILFFIVAYLFYMFGYSNGIEVKEKELGKFWGQYYNVEEKGSYWQNRAYKAEQMTDKEIKESIIKGRESVGITTKHFCGRAKGGGMFAILCEACGKAEQGE